MNVKKYLKKQAGQDLQSLETERDRAFLGQLENIAEENARARAKKRNLQGLWAIPSVAVAGGLAAVLLVELLPVADDGLDDIKYIESNFVSVDSDMNEFNGASDNLVINITADKTVNSVVKTYDQVSGDELYYTLRIEEVTETVFVCLDMLVVVNEHYDYENFQIDETFVTETVEDFSVNYSQVVSVDPDFGLNLVKCTGKIEKPNFEIYILNYEEYALDDGSFLNYIDDLLEFKT